MRRIARPLFYVVSLVLCLVVIITCIKVEKVVMVSTGSVKNLQANSATAEGTIVDIGEGITDHGHVYSTNKDVSMSETKVALGSIGSTGTFTSQLTGLTAGTTYYIKAYVTGKNGTQLGKEVSFKTSDPVVPTVITTDISGITTTTAISGGNVTADGGASITAKGVCWSTSSGPTVNNGKTTDGQGTGIFSSNLTGLTEGTTYFVRAYATNTAGTGYGAEISFSTVAAVLPTVTTAAVINISSNYAQGGGNVTSDGGAPIINKGVCWSKSSNPTTSDPKTEEGTGTGGFGISFGPLESATLYHVRAYATNSKGTSYGEDLTFTTLAGLPALTTVVATSITGTAATSGGNITNDGGSAIITKGVCWNTTGNPIPDGPKTIDGNGAGIFSSSITGLTTNTKYYYRAYATNSIGLAFGDELTFTTLGITTATLTTATITSIQKTSAIGGGNITDNGGSTITASGVCWSLNQTPTLADSYTADNVTFGVFSSQLTLLSPGKTYFVRAYATNASGTAYGPQVSFITASDVPTVTTSAVGTVTATTADVGGEVVDNNGSTTTIRGVCYNTVGAPTINDNKKDESGGIGSFTMLLTGLTSVTTYYVRAFAVNSIGTSYGPQIQFTTPVAAATLSTLDITGLASTSVLSGGNITSDGGSAIITKGICWNTSPNPTIALASKTNEGSGSGIFKSRITDLLPDTKYYARVYATNSLGTTFYGNELTFTTTIQVIFNGHTYNTVQIGTQLWFQENLRSTKYRDGADIPHIAADADWSIQTSGAHCWYGNNAVAYDKYGILYNYYTTIENHNMCPSGWRVPTDADWTTLTNYLGGESVAGGKLKEEGTLHWLTPNTGATNESGFTALAGGLRIGTGGFILNLESGAWWTSSGFDATNSWFRGIGYNVTNTDRTEKFNKIGFSVRCIQGEGEVLPAVTTTAITGITSNGAVSGGNVTSNGNSTITARGVCWSITSNPVLGVGNYTSDSPGTGVYSSTITDLSLGVTYFVRAYATNSVGTAYGDEVSFTTALAVGDIYQGGIIAYIFQPGDPGYIAGQTHGLIAAPSDQSANAEWGCDGTDIIWADHYDLGGGKFNTNDIVAGCTTAGIAARICSDLVIGIYNEWYLPSKDELNKLYINRSLIGNFSSQTYWSSTEYAGAAWVQVFDGSGTVYTEGKWKMWPVRAISYF